MKTVYKIFILLLMTCTIQFCYKSVQYVGSTSINNSTSNDSSVTYPSTNPLGLYHSGDSAKTDSAKTKTSALAISFTKSSPCSALGETFNFVCTPNSLIPPGATYSWNMGDGSYKYTSTVSGYSYTNANNYRVVVQASYLGQVIASKDTTIYAYGSTSMHNQQPTASFYIQKQPKDTIPNYFVCTNTTQSIYPYSCLWSFGDGSPTSTLNSPSHLYPSSTSDQTFIVQLITTVDKSGCTDTATVPFTIPGSAPNCSITYSQVNACGPGLETFNFSASLNGVPSESTYNWSFGDGTIATGPTPSNQYALPGTYKVILTISNSALTCSQIINANGINTFPIAYFTDSVYSTGNMVAFNDNSSIGSLVIKGYYWDFGDKTISQLESPVHTFPTSTKDTFYTVSFWITAANKCYTEFQKVVLVPAN